MLLTIIVFYSFIVRCLKGENKIIGEEKIGELSSTSVTSNSIASNSTSSNTTNPAFNHFDKSILQISTLNNCINNYEKREKDNLSDRNKELLSDDEVADNHFDEEEFYNIIATKAAAFQSKRNSSTSTISSGSIYDDTYRTKRNSLRSQSSTCSDIVESSSEIMSIHRRSSEDKIQNKKLNFKSRRHGFTTLSKRRRTTGRYF